MIIDLAEYQKRRRLVTAGRIARIAVARGGREPMVERSTLRARARSGAAPALLWSKLLPVLPALELGTLYADASLI